ncbi:DUF397 domain-containing protein [Nonomuraea longicatena]|uniref:DUF397 domain-containing protein n=1 Tax=Nonomuraea longicatena TaxID=83682 RepID=A0ABP4B287_9ACTN
MDADLSNATWRKARRSGNNGGNCVEVALVDGAKEGQTRVYAMRDSKNPAPDKVLIFTSAEWDAFRLGVKDGEFDDLS